MFLHMLMHAHNTAKEAHMTKLINFVMANGLYCHVFSHIIQFLVDAATAAIPEPGKLTLEVDTNL